MFKGHDSGLPRLPDVKVYTKAQTQSQWRNSAQTVRAMHFYAEYVK